MKTHHKAMAMLTALVLVTVASLSLSRNVSAAGEGKISGTIKLDGTPPHQKPIDMSKEPACAKVHEGNPVTIETVVTGSNGGLANVVLYISEGLSGGAASSAGKGNQVWDQKGCQYIPHVMALNVNEHFKITNSDPTSHNIHPMPKPGGGNNQWNKSQPPGAPPIDGVWTTEEVAVPVKCNIHPWMHGYQAVVKGPYAVSNKDGAYEVDNVPPGSYTVTAWQEALGTQTQKVTVAGGKAATADFTFKAK